MVLAWHNFQQAWYITFSLTGQIFSFILSIECHVAALKYVLPLSRTRSLSLCYVLCSPSTSTSVHAYIRLWSV